jgi:2-polyprenyl-3-methyl-5-hydroxy-6-metoxy-1,4-benzoquinol methylase
MSIFNVLKIFHVLEHISNPEEFIFVVMSKLKKKGGVLSINIAQGQGKLIN